MDDSLPTDSENPPLVQDEYLPVVTYVLLWTNVILWLVSSAIAGQGHLLRALTDGPEVPGLLAVGATHHELIFDSGQWWRWVSASFLHSGFLHLAFNSFALFLYGPTLERVLGRGSFLFLYVVSGIGGFFLSSVMSPRAVSVGASASVFGLIGAIWSLLKRRNAPDAAKQTIVWIIGLNFVWGLQPGSNIDNWGHAGGLLTGLVLGYLLESLPPAEKLRAALNAVFALLAGALLIYGLGNAIVFARAVLSSP